MKREIALEQIVKKMYMQHGHMNQVDQFIREDFMHVWNIDKNKKYSLGFVNKLYAHDDEYDVAFDINLAFESDDKYVKHLILGDFYTKDLQMNGGKIDETKYIYTSKIHIKFLTKQLKDFLYNYLDAAHLNIKGKDFLVLKIDDIIFEGYIEAVPNSAVEVDKSKFSVYFENVQGILDSKAVEKDRFLNSISKNVRDEFGDELLSM